MNEIIKKFALARDKFMSEMHLTEPDFTYSDFGTFTKCKERVKIFKLTGDSQCIYQNEIDKACFQYDMGQEDFKDLPRRTGSDKVLHDKVPNFAKNPK